MNKILDPLKEVGIIELVPLGKPSLVVLLAFVI